jgi:S-DNA-T family DNA segregation ATPase FtsK/SpoIIIE
MFGLPSDALTAATPPGRGFYGSHEVQVAVLGGATSTARQAAAIRRLADELRAGARWAPATPVDTLPEVIDLNELPVEVEDMPAFGVADDTLEPVGLGLDEPMLLAGPPQAARSRYLAMLIQSLRRSRPGVRLALFSARPSKLAGDLPFVVRAESDDDAAELANLLLGGALPGDVDGVVLEGLSDLAGGSADQPLQDLVRMIIGRGGCVLAEGDSNVLTSSYGIAQLMRSSRHGIALQPDQADGDGIFRTSFPRSQRAEFPVGRGFYVRHGRVRKVQCAEPMVDPA